MNKKNKSKQLAKVFHYDLYGKREEKYNFLNDNSLSSIKWNELENRKPEFFFVEKDFRVLENYNKGFKINLLFIKNSSGVQTEFDEIAYSSSEKVAQTKVKDINELSNEEIIKKYNLKISQTNKINKAKDDLTKNVFKIHKLQYKPFTYLEMIYTGQTNGIMGRPRTSLVKHILKNNLSLVLMRSLIDAPEYNAVFISNMPIDKNFYGFQSYFFPLYIYPDQQTDGIFTKQERKPNLNMKIVERIAKKIKLEFVNEKDTSATSQKTFAPIDILDYIYAVLHSPTYREKYKEFLKIDFPKVPYPKNQKTFWQLVKLGGKLRTIHLLENPVVEKPITTFPKDGSNIITRKLNKKDWELTNTQKQLGRIWINDEQYFGDIPLIAWEFYIGGYQPAQKWLKDRRGRKLNFEDIMHYQKIIVALTETYRLMKEIDKIKID